ncbi:MAG TPA: 50S ribosomal protein L25/general stress protein Ctc [Syntrophales bacterium]|nr:50S ribosomal protein L25/general stress protein Ctc [Syntrophales bacterium]
MEISELKANRRKDIGKGVARRLRKDGFVPAVVYGSKAETILLSVNSAELTKILKGKEENVFINLQVNNGKKMEKFTLIKELQIEPVSGKFLHIDFFEIDKNQSITLDIPIHFIGTAVGVETGGDLHHIKRDIKVSCLFSVLPEFIEVDVSGLNIGDSIKLLDIKLPEGVTVLDPEDTIIASVTAPKVTVKVEQVEEQVAEEPQEPEQTDK